MNRDVTENLAVARIVVEPASISSRPPATSVSCISSHLHSVPSSAAEMVRVARPRCGAGTSGRVGRARRSH